MRRILTALLIVLPFLAMAADKQQFKSAVLTTDANGNLAYEKVVPASNNKAELYRKMRYWITANTSSSDLNTLFDDNNHEMIIVSPTLQLNDFKNNSVNTQKVSFKLILSFKDNKMRIQASNFNYFALVGNTLAPVSKPLQDIDFVLGYQNPVKRIGELFDQSFASFVATVEKVAAEPAPDLDNW
jgi:hypothetical protein